MKDSQQNIANLKLGLLSLATWAILPEHKF